MDLKKTISWLNKHPAVNIKTIKDYEKKPGRNEDCPCGSKMKYKYCCWNKDNVLPRMYPTEEVDLYFKKRYDYGNKKYKEKTKNEI